MKEDVKYYLLNNKLPIFTNCSYSEIKYALINVYGYIVISLIEITETEYERLTNNLKCCSVDFREW